MKWDWSEIVLFFCFENVNWKKCRKNKEKRSQFSHCACLKPTFLLFHDIWFNPFVHLHEPKAIASKKYILLCPMFCLKKTGEKTTLQISSLPWNTSLGWSKSRHDLFTNQVEFSRLLRFCEREEPETPGTLEAKEWPNKAGTKHNLIILSSDSYSKRNFW